MSAVATGSQRVRQRLTCALLCVAGLATGLIGTAAPASAAITVPIISTTESYGGAQQVVSVHRPNSPQAQGRRPVAYFVHGGGWVGGQRSVWEAQAKEWASHGWFTVNIDYRWATESGDGAKQLEDVSTVVKKYESNPYADPARQVLVGDSAGGHLATTLGAKLRGHFVGVVAWSPVASPYNAALDAEKPGTPANQVKLGTDARRFFGYSFGTTSAFRYVDAYGGPPMWLAGSADEWVPWSRQGGALCDALLAKGEGLCEKHVVAGVEHGTHLRDANPDLISSAYAFAIRRIGTVALTPASTEHTQVYDVQVSAGHFKVSLTYYGSPGNIVRVYSAVSEVPDAAAVTYRAYLQRYVDADRDWMTINAWNGNSASEYYQPAGTDWAYSLSCDGAACPVLNTSTDGYGAVNVGNSRLMIKESGGTTPDGVVYRPLLAP